MQLTRAADYGVRVMIHLASLPAGARASLPEMARAIEVPDHFLSKVLQMLCRRRLIHSHRGAGGGFELATDPETVSLLDVVETIEGPLQLNVCLGDQGSCSRKSWCPAHTVWSEAQAAMARVLHDTSIASLARNALKTS
jgi:Rrf2 family protein